MTEVFKMINDIAPLTMLITNKRSKKLFIIIRMNICSNFPLARTKEKLAQFAQPKPAEIWPVESHITKQ